LRHGSVSKLDDLFEGKLFMYGLINAALKNMIQDKFGEQQWKEVLAASGVPDDSFLTMRMYDDELTFALAGAASKVLGAPVDACLEMFGEYWVLETATKTYGVIMDAAGDNMIEFLENINTLHDRITSTFLDYTPPEFLIKAKGDAYEIQYLSHRKGLTPFVVGLLKGLAIRFNCVLKILEQVDAPAAVGTRTVFLVEVVPI
jgi:hypothetical protein